MKNSLKKIYYLTHNKLSLKKYNLNLTYIFHTESIYDDIIFKRLIKFCKKYFDLTGTLPICAIIPPTSIHIKEKINAIGLTDNEFIKRVKALEKVSTLGYHGHFYLDNNNSYQNAMHCNSYNSEELLEQFQRDINWFKCNNINHNGIYTGGWWFINQKLICMLLDQKFKFDFTFSHAHFFYNQYSMHIMNENDIAPGEIFILRKNNNELKCIQNFIGAHRSIFTQDFNRKMISLLNKHTINKVNYGVINSHDYDLDFDNTIACIKHLQDNSIKFLGINDLVSSYYDQKINPKSIEI
jgi:hypothetical protein